MKKLITLLMVLSLFMTSVAFATSVPSKTTEDTTVVEEVKTETGVAVEPDFTISVAPPTEEVSTEIAKMYEQVTSEETKENGIIAYFPAEVQEAVKETLIAQGAPADIDLKKMTINEIVPVKVENYKSEYGAIDISLSTLTKYEADEKLVALIGTIHQGETTWFTSTATATEDGVKVVIPQEALTNVENGHELTVAIMSEGK